MALLVMALLVMALLMMALLMMALLMMALLTIASPCKSYSRADSQRCSHYLLWHYSHSHY